MSARNRVATHVLNAVSGRPEVAIASTLDDPGAHHQVPLLPSPYAFSTYRGS